MTIYYVCIVLFVAIGYVYDNPRNGLHTTIATLSIVVFSVVLGVRHNVGVDWINYNIIFDYLSVSPELALKKESGYRILNVLCSHLGFGIVGVMFFTTLFLFIFTITGAIKSKINPFYFFAITAPYHLVMSGMNFTRQSVALGMFVLAIGFLLLNKKHWFIITVIAASTFHSSVLVLLLLAAIDCKKRWLSTVGVLVIPLVIVGILSRYQLYVDTGMSNGGLILRLSYLSIPTIYFISNIKGVLESEIIERRLLICVILSIPVLMCFTAISPVIADRFSYYFIVMSTILLMRFSNNKEESFVRLPIQQILFMFSMLVFVVWSTNSPFISFYEFKSYFTVFLSGS